MIFFYRTIFVLFLDGASLADIAVQRGRLEKNKELTISGPGKTDWMSKSFFYRAGTNT